MKFGLCLLKAQFGGYAGCGMEYPQGHAEDGVAECLLLNDVPGDKADPGSCQKELLMNLFPLGDANRVAVYIVPDHRNDLAGKPIAVSGCFKNEGDKRQESNSGVKTLVDCVEEAAKQRSLLWHGISSGLCSGQHRPVYASGLASGHDQG